MPNDNETTPSINISVELSNIENFDSYTESYEKVKQTFLNEETLTALFKRQLMTAFAEHPTVEGVQWQQYTSTMGNLVRSMGPLRLPTE